MEGILYNELHTVFVKKSPNGEKECCYRVTVAIVGGHIGKALSIKLTDDSDSTFLFSLVLMQEDFTALKSEQGLRVDFENFPRQFTKLLADCKSPEKSQFTLILDDTENDHNPSHRSLPCGMFLKIIEQNEFKYLCHLCLRIAPGTDEDIKQHLCNKLKEVEDQLILERMKNSQAAAELESNASLLVAQRRKLNDLEVKLAEERSTIRLEASQRLAEEREKQSQQLQEIEAKHAKVLQELKSTVDLLTHRNGMCHEAKSSLESTVRELTVRNGTLENDASKLTSDNTTLKGTVAKLEQRMMETEQLLTSANRKLKTDEDSIKELTGLLSQARRDTQIARDRESGLMRNMRHLEGQLQQSTSQLSQAGKEIKRLEEELSDKRNKVANMLTVAKKLEGSLEHAKTELATKTKLLEEAEKSKAALSEQLAELTSKLKNAEETLKDHEATIKRQYDVNSYLHRKLNETDAAQNNNASLKSSSLGASLIAKNMPSVGANSTSIMPINRSLPPWLTGQGGTGDASVGSKASEKNSLKPRLDPSYLIADSTSITKSQNQSESAYFPRISARKDAA